jgi:hypothetical protein
MGSYQFKGLVFCLSSCPAVKFSKAMGDIFAKHIGKFVCVYLDDILKHSRNEQEHS